MNLCYNPVNSNKEVIKLQQKVVPGTVLSYTGNDGMFSMFRPMIEVANGLTLSQVCSITGLEASTVQNWVKRGFVSHPKQKKYFSRQLARILLISALRDCMKIEQIGELMSMVNGDPDDESDDIISEEQLYDYLCEAIGKLDFSGYHSEETEKIIDSITAGYVGPDDGAGERLKTALMTMVHAYLSGRHKQEADLYFSRMKEKIKNK